MGCCAYGRRWVKIKEPSFLMVLIVTEFGYKRDDGVYIVPIECLKD